jgi:hypothetical protein
MIGFWVVTLLIPNESGALHITTPSGQWLLDKNQFYDKCADAILPRNGSSPGWAETKTRRAA